MLRSSCCFCTALSSCWASSHSSRGPKADRNSRSSSGRCSGTNTFSGSRRLRVSPLPIGIALVRSLTLAGMTMITSTVLGVMAAQAFRRNFRGKTAAFYLIVLGMIVPGVLVGLGSALVATTTGIDRHWWTTAFATHVVYTLPFAFLVMLAIFNRFD